MQSYAEYKCEFMKDWTRKISKAAGVAEGRGKRGELLMEELCKKLDPDANEDQLHAFRYKWMRWKAGRQTPTHYDFHRIHARAVLLGYLGQGVTLRAIQERAGMLSQDEWKRYCIYEGNPEFHKQQDELWEQLDRLNQEEQEIKREKESLGKELRISEPSFFISSLDRAVQLELEAAALLGEAAEIRRKLETTCSGDQPSADIQMSDRFVALKLTQHPHSG